MYFTPSLHQLSKSWCDIQFNKSQIIWLRSALPLCQGVKGRMSLWRIPSWERADSKKGQVLAFTILKSLRNTVPILPLFFSVIWYVVEKFPYTIKCIQTDNGSEFTNRLHPTATKRIRRWKCTGRTSVRQPLRQGRRRKRTWRWSGRAGRGCALLAYGSWMYLEFGSFTAICPLLLRNLYRPETERVQPRCRSLTQSTTKLVLGFLRRMFFMSAISSGWCRFGCLNSWWDRPVRDWIVHRTFFATGRCTDSKPGSESPLSLRRISWHIKIRITYTA